jgi:hypothetical protein
MMEGFLFDRIDMFGNEFTVRMREQCPLLVAAHAASAEFEVFNNATMRTKPALYLVLVEFLVQQCFFDHGIISKSLLFLLQKVDDRPTKSRQIIRRAGCDQIAVDHDFLIKKLCSGVHHVVFDRGKTRRLFAFKNTG